MPALDDEEVPSVVVTNRIEHGADGADADEVHHSLRELTDVRGVALQEPLELLGPRWAAHATT